MLYMPVAPLTFCKARPLAVKMEQYSWRLKAQRLIISKRMLRKYRFLESLEGKFTQKYNFSLFLQEWWLFCPACLQ